MSQELLTINHLSYSYNGKDKILEDLNLSIYMNEIIQITGSNGIGKSTLLKIIIGLIKDKNLEYTATFKGNETEFINLRNSVAFVSDNPELFLQLTGSENIQFFTMLWRNDSDYGNRVLDFCDKFGIAGFLKKPVEEYSLGTQHKLFLAITLSRNVDIYLLDEPFNTLDVNSRKVLVEWINLHNNSSYIIVSHLNQEGLDFARTIVLDNILSAKPE